jgi:hypothetical protein
MNIRRYALLTIKANCVAGRLTHVWKFLRKYPEFLCNIYTRIKKIAIKRGIEIPKPLIDMEIEK